MYIKSIVIDGFKSYGRRTEINGFDREFNAITGEFKDCRPLDLLNTTSNH